MANFHHLVNRVIREADILLLVVDARAIERSINKELEEKVKEADKKYLYVVNKIDMLTDDQKKQLTLPKPSITVSAKHHMSTMRLLRGINAIGHGDEVSVGVIGYPNTGKSTLINALKGRHSASTSNVSGHTKGLQKIRVSKNILLIDTPGVYSKYDESQTDRVQIGAIDVTKVKDPVQQAIKLMIACPQEFAQRFGMSVSEEDPFEALDAVALEHNMLKKGGGPDQGRAAKYILQQWH